MVVNCHGNGGEDDNDNDEFNLGANDANRNQLFI